MQFNLKNIIPVSISLIHTFITLLCTDPESVAKAFISKIQDMDSTIHQDICEPMETPMKTRDEATKNAEPTVQEIDSPVTSLKSTDTISEDNGGGGTTPLALCSHILQIIYLCIKGKMPPIHYTISNDPAITNWHEKLTKKHLKTPPTNFITMSNSLSGPQSSDNNTSNTNCSQMSLKNQHVILALQKISENLDQNAIPAQEDSECKEPGFKKPEPH
jgi:hypothetical protein